MFSHLCNHRATPIKRGGAKITKPRIGWLAKWMMYIPKKNCIAHKCPYPPHKGFHKWVHDRIDGLSWKSWNRTWTMSPHVSETTSLLNELDFINYHDPIDGRNPAPPWMPETCWKPINNEMFSTYQLVIRTSQPSTVLSTYPLVIPNSYWKWTSRNREFSHEKWWIFPQLCKHLLEGIPHIKTQLYVIYYDYNSYY